MSNTSSDIIVTGIVKGGSDGRVLLENTNRNGMTFDLRCNYNLLPELRKFIGHHCRALLHIETSDLASIFKLRAIDQPNLSYLFSSQIVFADRGNNGETLWIDTDKVLFVRLPRSFGSPLKVTPEGGTRLLEFVSSHRSVWNPGNPSGTGIHFTDWCFRPTGETGRVKLVQKDTTGKLLFEATIDIAKPEF